MQRQLPAPFRPKLLDGEAVAGICLIRLERLRPRFLPVAVGLASENAAHRVAVEWEDADGRTREGVYGRGGTVLQPAIDLIEEAADFPKDAPLLVVTDGWCDVLAIHRPHAFLMSEGAHLPFVPRGPVFRMPNPGHNRAARP